MSNAGSTFSLCFRHLEVKLRDFQGPEVSDGQSGGIVARILIMTALPVGNCGRLFG